MRWLKLLLEPETTFRQAANLLLNHESESALSFWITDHATTRSADPLSYGGSAYLFGASDGSPESYTSQSVDLLAAGFYAQRASSVFNFNTDGYLDNAFLKIMK